jgi:hypothetical protein
MPQEFNRLNLNLPLDFNDVVQGGLLAGISSLILNQNPLLYYRFQETSGTSVTDGSGNNNTGTATSQGITRSQTPPVDEDEDFAYAFDGVNGFITVPTTSASLSATWASFTIEVWVRIPFKPSSEQTIIGKGDGPGDDHFQLSITPNGRIKFWWVDNASPKLAFSESVLVPNTWVHVVAEWNGVENRILINGVPGVTVPNVAVPVTSTQNIQIGAYNSAGRFEGSLDELALFATALDQEVIDERVVLNIVQNTIPVISSVTANGQTGGTLNITKGESVTFIINASDGDGDTLQYSFSPDGYIPTVGPQVGNSTSILYSDVGVFNPVAFVTDGKSNRAAPFARINVDPVADLIAFNDFAVTTFRKNVTIQVLSKDSFPAGGGGSIFSFTQPGNGSVVQNGTGEDASFTYTPGINFSGTDTFTYTITDGVTGFDTALVSIEVDEKQPPKANTYTIKVPPNTTDNLLNPTSNDRSDPTGEVLTITSVQNPTPAGGSAIISGVNQILYTPPEGFLGGDPFSYVIEDEAGLSAVGLINLEVTQIAFEALNDNYSIVYEGSSVLPVLSNDRTPFVDPLTITSITQPPVGEGVVTIEAGSTTLLYDASGTGFVGSTSFTYTLDDGTRQDIGTVTINVIERPPQARLDLLSTALNVPVSLDVMINDLDPEGEPLKLISFTQPLNGTVTREENGTVGDLTDDTLLYTPDNGFVGIDTFDYTIEDIIGQQASTQVNVAVSFDLVVTVNKAFGPVTESFTFSANPTAASGYDKSYTYFWDFKDGETSTNRTVSHLFVGIGIFEVTCTVTDSYGQTEIGTASVEVIANKRPIANDITVSVAEGLLLNFDPRDNDVDEDGDRIYILTADATSAQGGTVALNSNGTSTNVYDDFLTYAQPALATPFTDTFSYTISDEFGLEASATVTVNVLENLAPIAPSLFRSTIFEEGLFIDLVENATDPENDALEINNISSVSGGSVSIIQPERTTVLFTPQSNFLGSATFDYTIEDTFQNVDQSQVTVAVYGRFYPKTVVEDEPVSYYNFNEPDAQGPIAYDVRPAANHGDYVNIVTRDGTIGPLAKDLELCADMSRGYVSILTTGYGFEDQFSLEIWTRNDTSESAFAIAPFFKIENAGTRYRYTFETENGSVDLVFPNKEIGEWYYWQITYDGTFVRGYCDLELVSSAPLTGNVVLPIKMNPGLGMVGLISSLALYDKPLSLASIQAHYAQAVGDITDYTLIGPDIVQAGSLFNTTARARDITGKHVLTHDAETVTFSSDDAAIEFDADNDGNFGS